MSQDTVSDVLNQIMNAKTAKKSKLVVTKHSKFLMSILALGKLKGYIKDYKLDKNLLSIEIGRLNKCQSIKPRFMVTVSEIEKYKKRYLPARGFGMLIVSTSRGIVTSETAIDKKIGGSLIAYMY